MGLHGGAVLCSWDHYQLQQPPSTPEPAGKPGHVPGVQGVCGILQCGYLVASVMKQSNSDSQMMVGGILDRVASSALSGNNRGSDFMSSN